MARKTDLQSFMRFVFQEALTEKIGSWVLDKAKIGINYVRKFMLGREKFQSDRPHVWLPALILSPEDKKKKELFYGLCSPSWSRVLVYNQRRGSIWEEQRCRILQGRLCENAATHHLQVSTVENSKGLFLDYTFCLSLVGRNQPLSYMLLVTVSETNLKRLELASVFCKRLDSKYFLLGRP